MVKTVAGGELSERGKQNVYVRDELNIKIPVLYEATWHL